MKEKKSLPLDALAAAVSAIVLIYEHLGGELELGFEPAFVGIILCGVPIMWRAAEDLFKEHRISSELAVTIALLASVWAKEYDAAGEVAIFMALGDVVEQAILRKNRKSAAALYEDISTRSVTKMNGDTPSDISVGEISSGDIILLRSGETIPTDGTLLSDAGLIDASALSGEAKLQELNAGAAILSGSVNVGGDIRLRADCAYSQSTYAEIRQAALTDAPSSPIVRSADKWAPILVGAAFAAALLTLLFSRDIMRAVAVLVVFCPCAFVLAAPAAMSAALSAARRFGVLISSGDALEKLSMVKCAAFDKTGTLTDSAPKLSERAALASNVDEDELLRLSAIALAQSKQPLGRAIALAANISSAEIGSAQYIEESVRGSVCRYNGKTLLVGSRGFLKDHGCAITESANSCAERFEKQGKTVIFTAENGIILGLLALGEMLRPEAEYAVNALYARGLAIVMLTGDQAAPAEKIAEKLGIADIHSGLLPEQKRDIIAALENDGTRVLMCGDGINDAPALARASVSLSMGAGQNGSDAVLMKPDLRLIPELFRLSARTRSRIRGNIIFALLWNLSAVVLSAFGALTPILAALVHNIGSVVVLLSSVLLLWYRPQIDE